MAVDVNSGGEKAGTPAAGGRNLDDAAGGRNLDDAAARALGLSAGWSVFSYLVAGMVAYGAIGWVIGKAVHVSLLFPVGMLVGLAISVSYVIYRYGKQGSVEHLYGERARVERNDR